MPLHLHRRDFLQGLGRCGRGGHRRRTAGRCTRRGLDDNRRPRYRLMSVIIRAGLGRHSGRAGGDDRRSDGGGDGFAFLKTRNSLMRTDSQTEETLRRWWGNLNGEIQAGGNPHEGPGIASHQVVGPAVR
jgi:hypothetical protein